MNIYVGNLSYDVTDETIQGTFESFGEVTSAKVIRDQVHWSVTGVWFCGDARAVSGPDSD